MDLGDRGRQGLEGAVGDDDGLADLEGDLEDLPAGGDLGAGTGLGGRGLRGGGLLGGDLLRRGAELGDGLLEGQRHRVVAVPHEAGDGRGVLDGAPHLVRGLRVIQVHAHEHVAGDAHPGDFLLLVAVLDLDDRLHGDGGVEDVVLDLEVLGAGHDVGGHAALVAGVGVQHVPLPRQGRHLAAELGQRVDDGRLLDRHGRLSGVGRIGLGGLNRLDGVTGVTGVVGRERGEGLDVIGGGLRGDILRHGVPAFQWRETSGCDRPREQQRRRE